MTTHATTPDAGVVRRTQRIDIARSMPLGVIAPLETSVLLMIAIRHFDASGLVKGLIAAAGGVGLLASPAVTALARRSQRTAMESAAVVSLVGAAGMVLAMVGWLPLFVIGSIVGIAAVNAIFPLVTVTYEQNYPAGERGRRVGRGMLVKVVVSAPLAVAVGVWLSHFPDLWWIVIGFGAMSLIGLALLDRSIPSRPLAAAETDGRMRLLPHFELLAQDRGLRLAMGAWMLMGFGNLMLVPMRVEYLARPKYGIEASATMITVLTVAVPAVVRLMVIPYFGRLFDRLSVFDARILVNVLITAYVVAFFSGSSTIALWTGAVLLGIGVAGGDLLWMLWVTKFAPPDKVADYMGVHTFCTGLRAVSAPLVAFAMVDNLSLAWIAVVSVSLMFSSSALLVPEVRAERRRRQAAAPAMAAPQMTAAAGK